MNETMKQFIFDYVTLSVTAADLVVDFNNKSRLNKWLCKQVLGWVVWNDLQQLTSDVLKIRGAK